MTSIDVGFKTTGCFFAFLPQFIDGNRTSEPTGDVVLPMLAQGPLFVVPTAITMVGYALTSTLVGRYVVGRLAVMTWLRRAVAGVIRPARRTAALARC